MSKLIITDGKDIPAKHQNEHPSYEYHKRIIANGVENKQLTVSHYEIPPGKSAYPYHYHASSIEVFVILSGHGTVRTPDGEKTVKAGDILYFPTGERGAHKLTNTGDEPLLYVDISTYHTPEVSHMPDSGKLVAYGENLRHVFLKGTEANYYDGEE